MEPKRGGPDPAPSVQAEEEFDHGQTHPMDLAVDDPELDAWLAARDVELEEMAWALADQFNEDWRP